MLPEIKAEYLDIATIGDFKLCCYPSYLVFGPLVFYNHKLQFHENSYFIIKEHHFKEYFEFFEQILHNFENVPKNVETKLVSKTDSIDKNCVTFLINEIEDSTPQITLQSKYEIKLKFVLEFEDIYSFSIGFRNICFKIFCYPVAAQEFVLHKLKDEKVDYFTKKQNHLELSISISQTYFDHLTYEQLYTIGTIIERHFKLLHKIKTSITNLPEKVF